MFIEVHYVFKTFKQSHKQGLSLSKVKLRPIFNDNLGFDHLSTPVKTGNLERNWPLVF